MNCTLRTVCVPDFPTWKRQELSARHCSEAGGHYAIWKSRYWVLVSVPCSVQSPAQICPALSISLLPLHPPFLCWALHQLFPYHHWVLLIVTGSYELKKHWRRFLTLLSNSDSPNETILLHPSLCISLLNFGVTFGTLFWKFYFGSCYF